MSCLGTKTHRENRLLSSLVMNRGGSKKSSTDQVLQPESQSLAQPAEQSPGAAAPPPRKTFKAAAAAVFSWSKGKSAVKDVPTKPETPIRAPLKVISGPCEVIAGPAERRPVVQLSVESTGGFVFTAESPPRQIAFESCGLCEIAADEEFAEFELWKSLVSATDVEEAIPTDAAPSQSEIHTHQDALKAKVRVLAGLIGGRKREARRDVGLETSRPMLLVVRTKVTEVEEELFRAKSRLFVDKACAMETKETHLVRQRFLRTMILNEKVTRAVATATSPVRLRTFACEALELDAQGLKPLDMREARFSVSFREKGFILVQHMSDLAAAVRFAMPHGTSEPALQQWTRHAEMFCGPTDAIDRRGTLAQRFDKWVDIVRAINPNIG